MRLGSFRSSLGGGGPGLPIRGAHYKTRRRWTTMYWFTGTVYPPPAAAAARRRGVLHMENQIIMILEIIGDKMACG